MMHKCGPIDRRISLQGQSNAVGQGNVSDLSATPLSANPDLAAFASQPFDRVYIYNNAAAAYQKLSIGTNNMANSATQFGPEFGIAVRWTRETSKGRLFIDKFGVNGQAISLFQQGTSYWTNLAARMTAANNWLASQGIKPVYAGWVWLQGESDYAQTQAYYHDQLAAYIASRISAGMDPGIGRRVLIQMSTASTMYGATVASAKLAYAEANPTTVDITTMPAYFNADNLHSSARGQLQMGYDAFSKLFSKPAKAA